ncbi:prolyl oligopeptidase family serine peptidase [Undibacterium sp. 5I1]|uniref:alpha/beta hydrolase family protein n=1 Tax=unclassified Undibacterium TaxID=2630295 RepID=UPI002AB37796|nr:MULTISPECIES: prolyl oligopeptidase family serine peptidase [unclassified Undibacterium]MDY7539521.1 prolyl oligopeptidase family serine peptidase [Undibacterium sp. 5I1]MEB0232302.1 prolyl oligopeptidase family serine peptidase [Undibacterium sp. 10I3]MEB0258570.1 prolyl oligopeptidase family serine peptidase [Undibacterium sp. 5I1]
MRTTPIKILASLMSLTMMSAVSAAESPAVNNTYQMPAAELQAVVDAPRGPSLQMGPQRKVALLVSLPGLPSIADVAQPELKLAGLRINSKMRAASRFEFGDGMSLLDVATGKTRSVTGLPANPRIADTAWSADERWIAFSRWSDSGVELWLLDVEKASAHRLIKEPLNAVAGGGFTWLSGLSSLTPNTPQKLLVRVNPSKQAAAPVAPTAPTGPNVQESLGGKVTQNRTYPDMLKSPADADMLDWQLQSQLAIVTTKGELQRIGVATTLLAAQPSPDGKYILATQLRRPYSNMLPISRFPQLVEMWDMQGKKLKTMTERPLRDRLPPGNDAVATGPRSYGWRSDQPATLYWAEAQDDGDPNKEAAVRDTVFQQAAPFDGTNPESAPKKLLDLASRFADVEWGRDDLALVTEYWWKTRDVHVWRVQPGQTEQTKPELIFSYKSEDRYADPGNPSKRINDFGRSVLRTAADGNTLFLLGTGASPEGDRPFLDTFDLTTKKTTRLWRSAAPFYEQVLTVLDDAGKHLITSRESADERPNFYLRDLSTTAEPRALTQFPHPTPQFKGVQKQQINYKRADGVALSATLYLPPGYDPKRDGPRPMLMWAYPEEFKSAAAAGQVKDSPYKFNRISYWGPQVMLARGYTVLDHPAMPIVGEGKQEPNDTYLPQLKMDAEAAVDEVVRLGVADRSKIAIGGHSYGAFMTANLLAHTRLFRAGIARSGAYNRSLTPFGFQSEDRNFWDAKEVYQAMAPFNFADQIKDPILFIHGEQDNNPGTFPIQSERMYQALQGLGAVAKLVTLPNESHAYRARESILQMLYEQDQWLDKYVKNAKSN